MSRRDAGRRSEPKRDDFGVYLHYPLCRRRCGYCDFPTVSGVAFPARAYTDKLLEELRHRAPDYDALRLGSLYIGGGTPSLWPVEQLSRVIEATRRLFRSTGTLEVTLEANPGTLDPAQLRSLVASGVNRLSLGIQALDDQLLRQLDRDHTADDARCAVRWARAAGFDNINCDVIVGLAGQSLADQLEQLRRVLALEPTHVSLYSLTLARGSALFRRGARTASDDLSADTLQAARELLASRGHPQYEVSNYAAPSLRSRHNASGWQCRPYLGLGAAAHSLLVDGRTNVRSINPPFSRYLDAPIALGGSPALLAGSRVRRLGAASARFESMMLGLRTTDGVDLQDFERRFGIDPMQLYGGSIERLRRAALIRVDARRLRPTARGIWFADELALQLVEDGSEGGESLPLDRPTVARA